MFNLNFTQKLQGFISKGASILRFKVYSTFLSTVQTVPTQL